MRSKFSPTTPNMASILGTMVALSIVLSASLLLAGDVETNPGPPKSLRQQKLTPSQDFPKSPLADQTMQDLLTPIQEQLRKTNTILDTLTGQMTLVLNRLDSLEEKNNDLRNELQKVTRENELLVKRIDSLESHSRRNNLVITGVAMKNRSETWEETEKTVLHLFKSNLNIDLPPTAVERAHRLGTRGDAPPIIVKLGFFKDRQRILESRKKLKDKNSKVFIREDFTTRVRAVRAKLAEFCRQQREMGKSPKMVFDHVYIDGHRYDLDERSGMVVPTKNRLQEPNPTQPSPQTGAWSSLHATPLRPVYE